MKEYEYRVFLEAVVYMDAHMEEALQVTDIAQGIHVSESRLQRTFRACADTSVHAYLLSVKLNRAMEALQSGKNVGDAAKLAGFTNRNHFSYCFKKQFGITPSQARKMQPIERE